MNSLANEKILEYRNRLKSVTLILNGEEKSFLELKKKLHFSESLQTDESLSNHPVDSVALQEEWWVSLEEYDDILQRWPYPKQSHLFPKGWIEARRLCICVEADGRPDRLYINRDSFSDNLMIAKEHPKKYNADGQMADSKLKCNTRLFSE